MESGIELGDLVRDVVTGFEGIATSKHTFLTGCNRWGVQPVPEKPKKGGKITYKSESTAFDEPQLIVLEKGKVKLPEAKVEATAPSHRKHGGSDFVPLEKKIERR